MSSDVSSDGGVFPTLPLRRVIRPIPVIPDHEVVRQIGSGAYGEVWLAKSLTGAWRAVKIVRREDFDDDRTFNREFEGILQYEPLARNHPGLVHILHVGKHDEPTPFYYYVMELGDDAHTGVHIYPEKYIPRTLSTDKTFSGNKPLPLDYCLEVGSQLAHALLYLHSKGLTHRDVKPANVIFVNGRPKLADIGLVAHSNQHSFVGTEGFIPPDGPGTERADVYALAKVLYEVSTGRDRMDFPALPEELPEGVARKRWLEFNSIVCQAGEPRADECSIDTAELLAEKIDALRGYDVSPRYRLRKKTSKRLRRAVQLVVAAIAGGVCAYVGVCFLPGMGDSSEEVASPVPGALAAPSVVHHAAEDDRAVGYILITSNPPAASVFDRDGNYVEETPYGPVEFPAGTSLAYTIKKSGYADKEESGTVKGGETLVFGGNLKEYHPPMPSRDWTDTEGMVYHPFESGHRAADLLTVGRFNAFLRHDKQQGAAFPFKRVSREAAHPERDVVLLSQDGITAYLAWLNKRCEREGLLGKEFCITADVAPQKENEENCNAYVLSVSRTYQVPITVVSNPPGAAVFYNNKLIGRTPIEEYVNQGPYIIDVKLPGHASMRRRGLDPQDLYLSLQLEPDKSVIFGKPWRNSLDMQLVPCGPLSLAMAHEVRIRDFNEYVKETKRKAPPKPGFPQEADHPVVNVTRQEAQAFAVWLTKREQKSGLIDAQDHYRLPKDEEWSRWVALEEAPNVSPYEKSLPVDSQRESFPWGGAWPPPAHAGNFADESALIYLPSSRVIVDYSDQFPYTSPVMSMPPNADGMYDLSGNVLEWVSDNYGGPDNLPIRKYAVARGGGYLSFRPKQLDRKMRTPLPEGARDSTVGFRLILVSERPGGRTVAP